MKVILKHDVKGLGRAGDVKDVKDGYARNFLLPNGAAVMADTGALKNWERHRAERDERDRTRPHSPMVAAKDAVELDTTGLDVDAVVARIVALVRG
jgi:large subunit ribosomal protein L9